MYAGRTGAHNPGMDSLGYSKPPKRGRMNVVRLILGVFASLILFGLVAVELFAWLLPQSLSDGGQWYGPMAAGSFTIPDPVSE